MLFMSSGSWITLVTASITASMVTAFSLNDFQNIWHEIWIYEWLLAMMCEQSFDLEGYMLNVNRKLTEKSFEKHGSHSTG